MAENTLQDDQQHDNQDPALVQGMHQCRDTILNTVRAGFDNALVQVFSEKTH